MSGLARQQRPYTVTITITGWTQEGDLNSLALEGMAREVADKIEAATKLLNSATVRIDQIGVAK